MDFLTPVYVVEAFEILNGVPRQKHSYVVGIYTDLKLATAATIMEEHWRDSKYGCIITKVEMDAIDGDKLSHLTQCLTSREYEEELNKRFDLYSNLI